MEPVRHVIGRLSLGPLQERRQNDLHVSRSVWRRQVRPQMLCAGLDLEETKTRSQSHPSGVRFLPAEQVNRENLPTTTVVLASVARPGLRMYVDTLLG